MRRSLEEMWSRLQPIARHLAVQNHTRPPTFEDFKWAYSIFWCGEGGKGVLPHVREPKELHGSNVLHLTRH